MKKLISVLLALVLILGLATTALATEGTTPTKNDSITVNNAKVGETYNLYKMFDLIVNDEINPTAYSYTINTDWANFFKDGADGAKYITKNAQGYVTEIKLLDEKGEAAALAADAAVYAKALTAIQTQTATSTSVIFNSLTDGYYLITSTLGTKAMIETTPDDQNVTVNDKNPEDTITKEVKEDSTNTYGPSNDAQIGDLVEFKSTITLYPNTRNVKVHDTMDAGLTYTAGSVAIAGLTKGTDYTVDENPTDKTFVITFTDAYINGLTEETTLFLTYSATLNENAVKKDESGIAIVDQENNTNITYGDKQSVTSTTTTTTHKFSVFKHAAGSTTNLAGAVFQLKRNGTVVNLIKLDDNNYRVATADEVGVDSFTTVANGDIVIWGVDADTGENDNDKYTLFEKQAPTGYNTLPNEIDVAVNANNGTRVDVENNTGTELPSTGARGTVMMIGISAMVVMVAGVFMITRKRMSIYED